MAHIMVLRCVILLFAGNSVFAAAGCWGDDTTNWPSRLDSVALRRLPSVHSVTTFPVREASRRIIHIANQHMVPRDYFRRYTRRFAGRAITDAEIDARYDRTMEQVEAIQKDQLLFLRALVSQHDIRTIYLEGLPSGPLSQGALNAARDSERSKTLGTLRWREDRHIVLLGPAKQKAPPNPVADTLRSVYGAGGRLFLAGDVDQVRGIEPDFSSCGSSPEPGDKGWMEFLKKRDTEIVRILLSGDSVAVVILGGVHDLSRDIRSLSHSSCEYIKVETKIYWETDRGLSGFSSSE